MDTTASSSTAIYRTAAKSDTAKKKKAKQEKLSYTSVMLSFGQDLTGPL